MTLLFLGKILLVALALLSYLGMIISAIIKVIQNFNNSELEVYFEWIEFACALYGGWFLLEKVTQSLLPELVK